MSVTTPQERQGKRLAEARAAAGYKSARSAAVAIGIPYQTYITHENGTRSFAGSAVAYAKRFKVTTDWLLNAEGPGPKDRKISDVSEMSGDIAGVPLLGKVQAGAWLDISLVQDDVDFPMLPIARDDRFPHARQYALEVNGDSMDKLYPDGSYVTCVDFAESGLKLKVGYVVHVERHQAGGQLVENTLKAVDYVAGELALVPRSTNAKHQAFPLQGKFENTEIIVKGVVLWNNRREDL